MTKAQIYKLILHRLMVNVIAMLKSFAAAIPLGIVSAVIMMWHVSDRESDHEHCWCRNRVLDI